MKTETIIVALAFLLLLLWIPAAIDKILNFSFFVDGLHKQPFSTALANVLTYLLPAVELIIVVLLIVPRYTRQGFLASAITLAIFTNYIGMPYCFQRMAFRAPAAR
ncbi:MauE/DoxX family redox-associated membrane protein [Sphingobacterium paludis]|uniref:Methylamine utilisation protein MauE domain-containing protein n=1 Tax=Sphingobacterium paludis TaxID=1476465 RepID=A0A4R7CQL0_9SPHI|nr:MauE/DoxX family redox-associated membrane protein [Sphingobacterium paludis]TDS06811.1 hypothetical protein B0I21_11556 [Sphingobacterium paludis]